ncbi:hypothetical protein [Paludibacterium sp.]|uniref:hypothetical protein n=1 Tax=Paludibacterium sp. TaxID=1917523 RepID=UPI0025F2093A|nr:hypothetical protein [Paludibacterium sp.]MBV8647846.1 hypothetical protein [Paludibacterium sp.]
MKTMNFDSYVMCHGEGYVQYIVEEVERVHGIRYPTPQPLEYRWNVAVNQQVA